MYQLQGIIVLINVIDSKEAQIYVASIFWVSPAGDGLKGGEL